VGDESLSDRIEDTVDYRLVANTVQEVSDGHRFRLLEALAASAADTIVERFHVRGARVRVRKPGVDLPVEYAAATAERP
jgi:dihydroneopterin aldolase